MKFQLLSDIHLEYYKKMPAISKIITPSAPNLILAGDVCYCKHKNFVNFFEKISPLFENIFYVLGNHEYYTNIEMGLYSLGEVELDISYKLEHLKNVHIIQNDFKQIGDIVIIGSTLWSYLSKKDFTGNICRLTDTKFIKYRNKLWIDPTITNKLHLQYKQRINDLLSSFDDKKKLVITHFLPSFKCVQPKYKYDKLNKAYYSNCDELVKKADIWCCGHSNKFTKKIIENTPVFINPVGYLWEDTNYRRDFTFEL